MILTPKNWKSFQHYKDRAPSWIKLHKALLDDYEFACLPVASKALAPMLWLLASEYDDGEISATLDKLAFRLHMTRGDLADALSPLLEKGFFDASEPLADGEQSDSPEKENIEKRREEKSEKREDGWPDDYREVFWSLFPNKVGKPKALAKLDLCRKRGVGWPDILGGLRSYIRDKPPDRQWLNPETFLNQERWTDQPAIIGPDNGKTGSRIIQAADDLRRKIAGFDGPARGADELRSGPGAAPPRLLSHG